MNRLIKFRAWDNDNECFSFFDFSDLRRLAESIDSFEDYFSPGYFIALDEKTMNPLLMQYTGLKDKNGKEIYEGDIYHQGDKNITYTVVWHDSGLIGKQDGNSSYAGIEHWLDRIEVVGNIYKKS